MKLILEVAADEHDKFKEIFEALISTGGLTGVKSGATEIHFDPLGVFQKIRLTYFPWQRRR